MLIEVYSDGSSQIPRKPGGYGWLIAVDRVVVMEGNGWLRRADNNDAEVEGAYQGLLAAVGLYGRDRELVICSDSRIILGWIEGSYTFKKGPKNKRFHEIRSLTAELNLGTRWIRGHSGNQFNERCDELATMGRHRKCLGVSPGIFVNLDTL
jgi:ribonuclease HI